MNTWGKTNGYVEETDIFYDWQKVRQSLSGVLTQFYQVCAQALTKNPKEVLRLCEIYGGSYPNIKPIQGQHKPVQKRIFYSPFIKWRGFAAKYGDQWLN